MTLIPPGGRRRRPTEQEAISVELVSGLLMIIGFFAFGYLFYAIATNSLIKEATQGPKIPGIGLNVALIQPESTTAGQPGPYFELRPVTGGPAEEIGIKTGDHLTQIDGEAVDPATMTQQQVQARLDEKNVKRADDDFQITVDFLRPQPDGSLEPQTRTIIKNVAPTVAVAYLKSFAFVVPLMTIFFGIFMIRLGTRLRLYDIIAARWALVALLWMIVGLIVVSIWAFWVNGKGGIISNKPFNFGKGISHAIPFLLLLIPLFAAYRWLGLIMDELFTGEETLGSRNTRFAWTLLVPTLVILALVAARPLEQTFIKSLTDEQFGTSKPARFIGLDNYVKLISFKFTTVNCQKDANGKCAKSPNGMIIWQRSKTEQDEIAKIRTMSAVERQKYNRYREVKTYRLPGSDKGLRLLGTDPDFLNSIGYTLNFTVASVVLELVLGLIIALVVNSSFKGRGLMRAAMLVPWSIPTVVSAVLWQAMMRGDQTGILNKLFMDLGLISKPEQWLSATGPWMNSIIAIDVWKTAPFMALLLLAGLQVIPGDIYEAAAVDGASKLRQFFTITLPLLRPAIAIALIFRTLDALRVFDVFQVLLDSTRPSMASYNFNQLVLSRQDGYASAVGVMIFILIFIFTVIYVRFVRIEQE